MEKTLQGMPPVAKKQNPLLAHMRQPKVYIKLPSDGKYWAEGSINHSVNGEYPVYSMTAKDELLLKTPDALLNGQGIVDVIQSCIPNIQDAWAIPNIDIDVILIAIRIASYGHMMQLTVSHEELPNGQDDFEIDLRKVLDQIMSNVMWNERIEVANNLVLYVRPFDYKTTNNNSMAEYESQKIMQIVQDMTISEEQRLAAFKESFVKLTNITVNMINASVYKIDSEAGSTEDPEIIKEFMENADREVYDSVKTHLEKMKEVNAVKPMEINVSQDPEKPHLVEVPIVFDYSSFFV
jgi:uncharacterized protein YejL (UPF0352 family)